MKVSVIIPNYNHEAYFEPRIKSVLDQTFQDFEIIILDDCSTDNSKEIIEKYRYNTKIAAIIYNEENIGSSFKQWHKGISVARGDLVWIAESDDYADLNFLEKLTEPFRLNPRLVLSYCKSAIINTKNEITGEETWANALHADKWQHNYTNEGSDEVKNYFIYRNIIPNASAALFKREAFLYVDPELYFHLKYTGDWIIWVSLLTQGDISYNSTVLNYYRHHSSSTRSKKPFNEELRRLKEYFEVIDHAKKIFKIKNVQTEKHAWIIEQWMANKKRFKKNIFSWLSPAIPPVYHAMFFSKLGKVHVERIKRKLTKSL